MKKSLFLYTGFLLFGAFCFLADSAEARIGGGRSTGSRSSRGMGQYRPSAPRPDSGASPYRQTTPPPGYAAPGTAPGGGGLLRGLGAGMAGGFLGSMLFGGMSHGGGMGGGGGGGFGLFEWIVLGALAFFLFRWFKNRQAQQMAGGPSNSAAFSTYSASANPLQTVTNLPASAASEEPADVLRRSDSLFDQARFQSDRLDDFFRLQAAWGTRDLTPIRANLTLEMYQVLSADALALRSAGQINKLDNIAVRDTELAEAWEETGRIFATVRFAANLVDYTSDEKTGEIVAGSRTEPVKFQEFWTFSKEVGTAKWQLAAIEQQA